MSASEKSNNDIFFDLSVELFCTVTENGIVSEANISWEKILEVPGKEIIGSSFTSFVVQEDIELTKVMGAEAFKTSEPVYFENRLVSKTGKVIWISWSIKGCNGLVYAVGRNVTSEIEAHEEAIQSKVLLETFVKQSPAAIAMFDSNFCFVECSNLFLKELNLPEPPARGYDFKSLFFNSSFSNQNLSKQVEQVENVLFKEELLIDVNGKGKTWFELSYSRWFKESSQPGGIICLLTNVQDRKIAQEQLVNKSEMLNGVLQNLPVIMFRLDKDGNFLEYSGSGLKVIGHEVNQLIGENLYDIYPEYCSYYDDVLKKGESISFLSEVLLAGRTIYFQSHIFPDTTNKDEAIGFALDITEKIEGLKDLVQAKLDAEKANFSKSRFLANMSHEIRTPLNSIIGFADLLSQYDLSKKQREYIDYILTSGQTLMRLIGDILDLTKIEEGKMSLEPKSFPVRKSITNALLPYKFKANEKGLNFSLQFDEFIPEVIIADFDKLHQVLVNLISNSIKFTKVGGITVSISSEGCFFNSNQVQLKFCVTDTGIGVPKEKQDEVFNSFTQSDPSVVREYGGSGLGLAISKQLVQLMGGEIKVTSPVSNGTYVQYPGSAFYFLIKVEIAKDYTESSIKVDKYTKFQAPLNVLVAEDNLMNQKLAEVILKNLNCNPEFAGNGEEAVHMALSKEYDIILMDVQMPIMDGTVATRKIRNKNSTVPIIALTAHVYKEDVESFIQVGMNDYIGKPYTEHQLFSVLQKWTETSVNF